MPTHHHPPSTPGPADREAFLVDGCERCAEYVDDMGLAFDADRFRAFWAKMVEVEYDDRGYYASALDRDLGRRLYRVSLAMQRAFGTAARSLPDAAREHDYLSDRCAVLATAVGAARVDLAAGRTVEAAAGLDEAASRTRALLRVHLVARGLDEAEVDRFLGLTPA